MTGVGTKYLFPWCCCLNLANNVSSVARGKLEYRYREQERGKKDEEQRKRKCVTDYWKASTEPKQTFTLKKL